MYTITDDKSNKDVPSGMSVLEARQHYIDMWGDASRKLPLPQFENFGDKVVLRADLVPGGFKAMAAEKVIRDSPKDTLVYCAPRQGHAPDAIATLAKIFGKRVVFFLPASKKPSDHQAALLSYDNVELRFVRIAAMPVLNKYAREWAERNGAHFLPFGLSGDPSVTSGIVHGLSTLAGDGTLFPSVWCAVSTGTMIRAAQIAWPMTKFYGVAVARNMKPGEIGEATMYPTTMPFLRRHPDTETIPFPTTGAYDSKAWFRFTDEAPPGSLFINVGSDDQINRNLNLVDVSSIDSQREWGDMRDCRDE